MSRWLSQHGHGAVWKRNNPPLTTIKIVERDYAAERLEEWGRPSPPKIDVGPAVNALQEDKKTLFDFLRGMEKQKKQAFSWMTDEIVPFTQEYPTHSDNSPVRKTGLQLEDT